MKERPILFNGEMVRAILEGRKTQTRRVVKLPVYDPDYKCELAGCELNSESEHFDRICPYGTPGDRLWVRETFTIDGGMVFYRADGEKAKDDNSPWTPSIHMPRWASRITLEVKSVRVERVQDITERESQLEGFVPDRCANCGYTYADCLEHGDHRLCSYDAPLPARNTFSKLWDSINTQRGYSWESNPWVWAVEFEVIENKQH